MAELNVNEIFSDDIIETSRRKHTISTLASDPHGQAIYWAAMQIPRCLAVRSTVNYMAHAGECFTCESVYSYRYICMIYCMFTFSLLYVCIKCMHVSCMGINYL